MPISAQSVRTDAPCSPVIDRTQGNVTVNFTGGCTAGMTPTELQQIIDAVLNKRAVALESFEELAQRFGVTSMAVTTFFRILGENRVPVEDLDAKLREVASRHLIPKLRNLDSCCPMLCWAHRVENVNQIKGPGRV